ncbi:MAG: LD-carboxypeptidase, partial [Draconibacterium sp.]
TVAADCFCLSGIFHGPIAYICLMTNISPIVPGDKIRIVSPAGKIAEQYVLPAVEWFRQQGFRVELGANVFARHYQFAGTDQQRLYDLQQALDDPDCKAIICSRGGYGSLRLVNRLKLSAFMKQPKWLVGFSDITVLHSMLQYYRIPSIHGAMPRFFFTGNGLPNENLNSLMQLLMGNGPGYVIKPHEMDRNGSASGELIGGNLSLIASLMGTPYEAVTRGKILFLEEIDEYLYHTDRMLQQLKLSGKLDQLAGLVIGSFTNMKDNEEPFGKDIPEIVLDAVGDFSYPVCFGFPAGHDQLNLALAFGHTYSLEVGPYQSSLSPGRQVVSKKQPL